MKRLFTPPAARGLPAAALVGIALFTALGHANASQIAGGKIGAVSMTPVAGHSRVTSVPLPKANAPATSASAPAKPASSAKKG